MSVAVIQQQQHQHQDTMPQRVPSATDDTFKCPADGCTRTYTCAGSLRNHLRRKHYERRMMPKSRFSYKARASQFFTPPPSNSVSPEPQLNPQWHPNMHMQQQQQQHGHGFDVVENTWGTQNATLRPAPYTKSTPSSRSGTPNAERAAHNRSASQLQLQAVSSIDSVVRGMSSKLALAAQYSVPRSTSPDGISPPQSGSMPTLFNYAARPAPAATATPFLAQQQYMMDSAASYALLTQRRTPVVTSPTSTDKYLAGIARVTQHAALPGAGTLFSASGQQQQQQYITANHQLNLTTSPDSSLTGTELSNSNPASAGSLVNVICDLLAEADAIGSSMAAVGGQAAGLVVPQQDTTYGLGRMYTY